jgi:transketolase
MALAAKRQKKEHRVFCMLSDGECDEGSNWEAILFAAHHKLDNLVAVVDYNNIQSLATITDTLTLEPFVDKWESFGWSVREIDGHDHEAIRTALVEIPGTPAKPGCILAHTTKGKGVSFMENSVLWHYRSPQGDEFERAMKELDSGDA